MDEPATFEEAIEHPMTQSLVLMMSGQRERVIELILDNVRSDADAFSWMAGYARAIKECTPGSGDGIEAEVVRIAPGQAAGGLSEDLLTAIAAIVAACSNDDNAGAIAVYMSLSDEERGTALWTMCQMAGLALANESTKRTNRHPES